ncbi:DNA polymerase [Algibacter sp.]|nr:DNA polymerase [Algibacter sp.]MDB4273876.1 DNA polymerase [Algibacter sp.]
MDLITLDFETYYSKEYSLGKLTTEEYIRDPKFEVIGVAVKINNQQTEWASGTHEELKQYLQTFDWEKAMVLAHNTMFDGAILSWIFNINPRVYTDTLCISRGVNGVENSSSLKALSEKYDIGAKGTEVIQAIGKNRKDFTQSELEKYGDYCINDVDLTYKLFYIMGNEFPKKEFKLIDATLRMFINPILDLDLAMLEQHLMETRDSKDELLTASGVSKEDLMSNPKFAEVLKTLGVEPPMKISLTTGKETFAFAKSDEEFKALETHPDARVQTLVTARLGTKSTLEETRTQRFIDICKRGLLPVPVKYYAAHTGRWGGDDKINLQNLPSRGINGKKLKRSIIAPEGYTLIDADSAQIEARVLAWLATQDDLTKAFTDGEDVYVKMASRIYDKAEEDITKDERFVGKTTILGAGYGMGALKFQSQLKTFGFDMKIEEARRVIKIYRETNWKIDKLWRDAQQILVSLSNKDQPKRLGRGKVLITVPKENAIRLPSGLLMRYEGLDYEIGEKGEDFSYQTRRGRTRIYGGKVVENVCQAIARCIIGEQMLEINKKHRAVLTVHDSIVCCVKDEEVTDAQKYIEKCMRWTPEWADGLPINCESGTGKTYGDCE